VIAVVFARDEASAANEAAQHVGHDGAVQVGHHHHVKLVGVGHELHAAVVDDHVVVLHFGVLLGNLLGHFQEEAVRQLPANATNSLNRNTKYVLPQKKKIFKFIWRSHDVGLVDGGDLLASVPLSVLKSVPDHTG
jgi:hypothetical protein